MNSVHEVAPDRLNTLTQRLQEIKAEQTVIVEWMRGLHQAQAKLIQEKHQLLNEWDELIVQRRVSTASLPHD